MKSWQDVRAERIGILRLVIEISMSDDSPPENVEVVTPPIPYLENILFDCAGRCLGER